MEKPIGSSFVLNDAVYAKLKFVALILLPALTTLYFTLAAAWEWPNTEQVIGSSTAFDTFLGIVLGISTKAYNNSEERFDGHVMIEPAEDGSKLRFNMDPADVIDKKEIRLKVGSPPQPNGVAE